MPIYLEMPKLSDTMTEGTIAKWKKSVGDFIEMGEVIAEVETDKATMEMEAFDDGLLHAVLVNEGGKAAVGACIAVLLAKGEEPPSAEEIKRATSQTGSGGELKPPTSSPAASPQLQDAKPATAPASKPSPTAQQPSPPTPPPPVHPKPAPTTPKPPTPAGSTRIKASPLARKLAEAQGLSLDGIRGSGPGGRIVAEDVRDAIRFGLPCKSPAAAESAFVPVGGPAPGETETIPLSGMRRVIAQRLLESKTQLPHFYLNIEIDAEPMMTLRKQLKEAGEDFGYDKVTVNDFILRAVAIAAKRVPAVNATFTEEGIIRFGSVQLAVAVAVEDGLITPVITDAQSKNLRTLSAEMKELAAKARNKKLKPEEYQGGTITVSNLGAYGIDQFYAIINPPQSVIVSVGAVVAKPVVTPEGDIRPGRRMNIGLSSDHRVVDGAVGAAFLAELKKLLEAPALLLA